MVDALQIQNHNREEFLKILEEVFGEYEISGSSIKFDKFTNKQIAESLALAESQFSSYLNPSRARERGGKNKLSYTRMIQKVELYRDAKAYRDQKSEPTEEKKEVILEASQIPTNTVKTSRGKDRGRKNQLATMLGVWLLLSMLQLFLIRSMNRNNSSDLYVDRIPEVYQLVLYVDRTNRYCFQRDAVIESSQSGSYHLTANDSLEMITRDIVTDGIDTRGSLNCKVKGELSLFELANRTITVHSDTTFKVRRGDFFEVLKVQVGPRDISPFDSALLDILPFIFKSHTSIEGK